MRLQYEHRGLASQGASEGKGKALVWLFHNGGDETLGWTLDAAEKDVPSWAGYTVCSLLPKA